MPVSLELQSSHALPLAVAVASSLVMVWGGFKVGAARKKYKVKYPNMYAIEGVVPKGISAADADMFNCAQRAHQNLLENYTAFLTTLAIASVNPDRAFYAGIFGAVRLAGFIVYNSSYRSGDPAKRQQGAFGYLGALGLLALSVETIYNVATA